MILALKLVYYIFVLGLHQFSAPFVFRAQNNSKIENLQPRNAEIKYEFSILNI